MNDERNRMCSVDVLCGVGYGVPYVVPETTVGRSRYVRNVTTDDTEDFTDTALTVLGSLDTGKINVIRDTFEQMENDIEKDMINERLKKKQDTARYRCLGRYKKLIRVFKFVIIGLAVMSFLSISARQLSLSLTELDRPVVNIPTSTALNHDNPVPMENWSYRPTVSRTLQQTTVSTETGDVINAQNTSAATVINTIVDYLPIMTLPTTVEQQTTTAIANTTQASEVIGHGELTLETLKFSKNETIAQKPFSNFTEGTNNNTRALDPVDNKTIDLAIITLPTVESITNTKQASEVIGHGALTLQSLENEMIAQKSFSNFTENTNNNTRTLDSVNFQTIDLPIMTLPTVEQTTLAKTAEITAATTNATKAFEVNGNGELTPHSLTNETIAQKPIYNFTEDTKNNTRTLDPVDHKMNNTTQNDSGVFRFPEQDFHLYADGEDVVLTDSKSWKNLIFSDDNDENRFIEKHQRYLPVLYPLEDLFIDGALRVVSDSLLKHGYKRINQKTIHHSHTLNALKDRYIKRDFKAPIEFKIGYESVCEKLFNITGLDRIFVNSTMNCLDGGNTVIQYRVDLGYSQFGTYAGRIPVAFTQRFQVPYFFINCGLLGSRQLHYSVIIHVEKMTDTASSNADVEYVYLKLLPK